MKRQKKIMFAFRLRIVSILLLFDALNQNKKLIMIKLIIIPTKCNKHFFFVQTILIYKLKLIIKFKPKMIKTNTEEG